MKALVLTEYRRFEYMDMPEPQFRDNDVLVKVKACGICGSDVHGMDGSSGRRQPPIVMGHEAAGVIAKAGSNVADWKQGDRVTFDSTVYCGECWFCRKGSINLCDNRRVFGVSCGDYRQHGAFAEYVAVPQHILYKLPDEITFEQAAMAEALSIAFHAVERTHISLNNTAAVVGTGIIGLLVVQSLRAAGCGDIIAVDVDRSRLDMACRLGADVGLSPNDCDVGKEVLKMTSGKGADLAFEVAGVTATIKMATESLRKGGSLTLVGNISKKVELSLQSVVTRELTLYGSCASCGEYPACLDMISRGKIDVDALISNVVPLSEGAAWFKRLYNREPGLMKVILTP